MTTIDPTELSTVTGGGALANMKQGALDQGQHWLAGTFNTMGRKDPLTYLVGPFAATAGCAYGAGRGLAHTVNPNVKMPAPFEDSELK